MDCNFVAAIITTILSLAIIGRSILAYTPKHDRLYHVFVMALHLPMCALAFYLLRMPLDAIVRSFVDPPTTTYLLIKVCFAPITEELSAMWLVLFPSFRNRLVGMNALRLAISFDLGFGIGEPCYDFSPLARRSVPRAATPISARFWR